MGSGSGSAGIQGAVALAVAALYAGVVAALLGRDGFDPALAMAAGPLCAALAIARLRRPAFVLAAAAPLAALLLSQAARTEAVTPCDCGPALDAALIAAALIAGSRLPPGLACAVALTPALAAGVDLSGPALRAGPLKVLHALPPASAFPLVIAALALAGASLARRAGLPAAVSGLAACVVLATGISWHGTLEVPALVHLLDRPALLDGRAARWAADRLLARGDLPAVSVLLPRLRDARLPAVLAAASRLGAPGEQLVERELLSPERAARLAALDALQRLDADHQKPTGARAGFLEAVATHRIPWPDGCAAAPGSAAAAAEDLQRPDRARWWPAAMALLKGHGGTAPGTSTVEDGLARLQGRLPPGTPNLAELRLLWHENEGVRLAAATALALSPGGIGRIGDAPRVIQILTEARAHDDAAPFDRTRTPFGPTAPFRALLLGELARHGRLTPAAEKAASADPVWAFARDPAADLHPPVAVRPPTY